MEVLKALFFFDDWLLHARDGMDRKQGQSSMVKEIDLGSHPELSYINCLRLYYDECLGRFVMYVDCGYKEDIQSDYRNFTFRLDTDDLQNWPLPEWASGSGPLWTRIENPVLDQDGNPLCWFDIQCLAGTPLSEKGYFMNLYNFKDN